ncbi:MAG TPA: DUF2306 domain-containing protein [Labilithrix sp.]
MTKLLRRLPRASFFFLMFAGWAFILVSSLGYFDFSQVPAFMLEKLPLRHETLWLFSLRVHVAAALLSLPLCTLLMTRAFQRRAALHRWLGRASGMVVLFALVPSGVVLAFDAKGGRLVTAGFLLSGAIVLWSGVRGISSARKRDLVTHRRMMRHLFAQMTVAVTSRAMLIGFDALRVDPLTAYVVALWAPVLASAAVAELASPTTRNAIIALSKRIFREIPRLALVVRARSVGRPLARAGR